MKAVEVMVFLIFVFVLVGAGFTIEASKTKGSKESKEQPTTETTTKGIGIVDKIKEKIASNSRAISRDTEQRRIESESVKSVDVFQLTSKIIEAQETDFNWTTVISNDNGGLSIGRVQWHNERAGELLIRIYKQEPSLFSNMPNVVERINRGESSFIGYIPDKETRHELENLLGKETPVAIQKELMIRDIQYYHQFLSKYTDDKARIFLSDIVHQYGVVAAPRYFKEAEIEYDDSLLKVTSKWSNFTTNYRDRRLAVLKMIEIEYL